MFFGNRLKVSVLYTVGRKGPPRKRSTPSVGPATDKDRLVNVQSVKRSVYRQLITTGRTQTLMPVI